MQHVEKIGCVEKVFARRDRFEALRESVVRGDDHREGGTRRKASCRAAAFPWAATGSAVTSLVTDAQAMRSASMG